MANINLTAQATAKRRIDIVSHGAHCDQLSLPAAEAITAGAPVRIDDTTGRWTNANASSAAESDEVYIAMKSVSAGETTTGVKRAILGGYDLSILNYGDALFLSNTDGRLADAAGTVSLEVGHVVPGTATTGSYDKLLSVRL